MQTVTRAEIGQIERSHPRRYVVGGASYSREEIVHRYLHLVKYVAGRVLGSLPRNIEIDDLIGDGILGLIDAIEKYDDARGVKFETYAITRIHGAVLDALRALDWVPRTVRQSARELERAQQELELELGRAPSHAETAARLGLSWKQYHHSVRRIHGAMVVSLEDALPNEKGHEVPLADTLRDNDADISIALEAFETRRELIKAVAELPVNERKVIMLYYFEGKTLREIKNEFGVSESRISQIHTRAVMHLRQRLHGLFDPRVPAAS